MKRSKTEDKTQTTFRDRRMVANKHTVFSCGTPVTCKFYEYLKSVLVRQMHRHLPTDLDVVVRDWRHWMYDNRTINIYIITNDFEDYDTQTHVGSHSDLVKRFKQHNGEIPGGPQNTKRAAGYWNVIFYMKIPPIRNFSCVDIVRQIDLSRGLPSRCRKMVLFALAIRAEFKISRHVLEKGHQFYTQVVDEIIRDRFNEKQIQSLFLPDDLSIVNV